MGRIQPLLSIALLLATVCGQQPPIHNVTVLKKYPHDTSAFTQGFEYENGYFWESTGLRGSSSLRRVRISDGKVLQIRNIQDPRIFGEGLTLVGGNRILMLSWQAGQGFVFDKNTFGLVNLWRYRGEGWGLTLHEGADEVWMSDGTSALRVLNPANLTEKRRLSVTLGEEPIDKLNEIEWVCGEVWANVWLTKNIVRIDPTNGVVKGVIDCANLPLPEDVVPGQDVLNGIAFDPITGRLWLTGKKWSKVYEVKIDIPDLNFTNCQP